jgi:hypothetical protein
MVAALAEEGSPDTRRASAQTSLILRQLASGADAEQIEAVLRSMAHMRAENAFIVGRSTRERLMRAHGHRPGLICDT